MDLLDLELDLNVPGSRDNSQGPVTRRSQASRIAKTSTPTAASTSSATVNVKSTPKSSTSAAKATSSTPRGAPKSASKATPKPKIIAVDTIKAEEPDMSSSNSSSVSRAESTDRDSRSLSLESKRNRNKAKKRFSPSPEAPNSKKRRTHTSTPRELRRQFSAAEFKNELSQKLVELDDVLTERGALDYQFPEEWKSEVSRIVDATIEKKTSDSPKLSSSTRANEAKASTAETADSSTPRTSRSARKRQSILSRSEMADREDSIGKDVPSTSKTTPAARKTSRKSESVPLVEPKLEEPETEDPTPSSSKRQSKRKSSAAVPGPEPSSSSSGSSEAFESHTSESSALSIRQRLFEKKTSKKVVPVDTELEPKPEPIDEDAVGPAPPRASESPARFIVPESPLTSGTPSTSSSVRQKATTPTSSASATRVSGRVSKPNRLYVDNTFNTEVLGRARVTEQNLVNEAAKEATPPLEELPTRRHSVTSTSGIRKKPPIVPKEVVPKPPQIINGVLRGYIPSRKVPLEDLVVDGEVIEKLNEEVTVTVDKILLKVCGDGVLQHEDIDPHIARAKRRSKIDVVKKTKIEARKLQIQMRTSHASSSSSDLGKRRRIAPKTDDYFYTPTHKSKNKEAREELDMTPIEEDESLPQTFASISEKKQQRARESISHQFDAEMDAQMREAREYKRAFDRIVKPRIEAAEKRASIRLMSCQRKSAVPDDFYYHEMLTDQPSPSNSNVENEEVQMNETDEVDVEGGNEEEIPLTECAIGARTEALDIAEQVVALLPRPTRMDGSPVPIDEIQIRAIEQPDSRKKALKKVMDIILEQLSHESAPTRGTVEEQGTVWHTVTGANAQDLKTLYTLSNASREDAITWTHQYIVENLPAHVLASYLSVLRYARRLNPNPFGFIVNSTDGIDPEWSQATALLKSFVYKKTVEPGLETIVNTIPFHRLADTVFLLVSPTMTLGGPNTSSTSSPSGSRARQHARLFRWIQMIGHPSSETIGFNENIDATTSMAEYLTDTVVRTICRKVHEKNRDRPHCKIVLVGYGYTTYIVHRVANMIGGISGIISLGFPVMTKFGRRGTVEDEILLTYCPTLFVCGAEGSKFCGRAMAELRDAMIAATGLVVIGHANDLLLVPPPVLARLGISQTFLYRMILEKILDFLSIDVIRDANPQFLTPPTLNNIYDLDASLLKSDKALSGLAFQPSPSTSAMASPIGTAGRRATVAGGEEPPSRKKKTDASHHPAHSSFQPPPALAPSPRGSAAAEERYLAFQNLVTLTVNTGDDMPRRASMSSSPRVVERGDLRDRAPRPPPPPPPQPTAPKGPIDPASISLI